MDIDGDVKERFDRVSSRRAAVQRNSEGGREENQQMGAVVYLCVTRVARKPTDWWDCTQKLLTL